jgi:lipid-A-disaccharide synthase
VEIAVDQSALAVGGFVELAGSLGRLASAWRRMRRLLLEAEPDLIVLVDSGGFNIPLAGRAHRLGVAPILYYVAPQVWAWRRGRIRKLARRVDRLAVIFPFEPEVYEGSGLCVDFVGHPLVDSLGALGARLDQGAARRSLGLNEEGPLVALLPGSRRNEIAYQLPVQLAAARILHERTPGAAFALALAPSIDRADLVGILSAASLPPDIRLATLQDRTHEVMCACDVALAKPGTVTVELALLGRPMVVMGRASALTAAIVRRAVRLPSLTMPNLIADAAIVPEFLQEGAQPERIAESLIGLLAGPAREAQLAGLADVRFRLGEGGAAVRASAIAEEMIESPRP